ncbi:NAD-dependent epimerase/dehydratase family protein [Aureibacter tunicatorum]|uniref:Nucleoside-diphosphate-sugar epimerase n=1 Tax=Aureibacter tunicatorum TaxID=866807 RepID=A0AAE3XPE5_9BACT|nr:NAD-dependent epimerase/dehydratase family protein [Aureibacter tunicatorum]MDR6240692.1 nucleoside-diphosphate-sugar epimerase [Aureibacter tunicatorum]BDD06975.1 N-acetyl-alpha-D-glucosaminyl-diphospho-ditrans, octacis-undecaprenol 4-epimerase [Aureibacter tunicatorum]
MKVCIVGGSGFIGSRLIKNIVESHSVVNIDKSQSSKFPEITYIGDIRNNEQFEDRLKDQDIVVLLAAEHRDDVSPKSLYYDVNVDATQNVLDAMDKHGVKNIIFTSSVAVYGLNKVNPDENHAIDPFNDYGKSKYQAEEVLRAWYNKDSNSRSLNIIRPTVVFGEENRGNVYNLLKQIATGKFLRIGHGQNKKSMAYVGNIIAFIEYLIDNVAEGTNEVYNYIDKPDLSMNELVSVVEKSMRKKVPSIRIPYSIGMLGGYCFDFLATVTGKKLPISSVRVKKFCATTQFDARKVHSSGFKAPFTLEEGLDSTLKSEFLGEQINEKVLV